MFSYFYGGTLFAYSSFSDTVGFINLPPNILAFEILPLGLPRPLFTI